MFSGCSAFSRVHRPLTPTVLRPGSHRKPHKNKLDKQLERQLTKTRKNFTSSSKSELTVCVGTLSMAVGLQVMGLILGVVSWCLQSSSTSSQVWKMRSQAESVTTSQWQFEGLWMSCAATSLGSIQCSKFKTLLGLPAHLQACRALMILSLLVGLASIIVSVLGLRCTKLGRTSEHIKDQIALSGGIMFILSGVFSLTAVSWYAGRVIHDFYDPLYGGVRFELGTGLYLGWAASSLAVLGGSLLCCSCRRTSPAPPARQFSYNYSTTSRGQNIYRVAPASDSSSSKAYV
ncbi:claudin-1-like [Mastacembelus armatus]|uniref:Claudin 15-like b n=1 Tax=Mastacembelus armatus TaxID=205130 RepID=A0A3Q3SQF5_9TELE|nr:claudin-1-like [Mastacembelus armatus]